MTAGESDSLARGIAEVLGAEWETAVEVSGLVRLTGGASRQTWAARVSAHGRERYVVLRRDPPGHGDAARMGAEADCLRVAAAAGVPVPDLLAHGDDAPGIDAPFLITARVDGEALARRIQRDPEFADIRTGLAAEMGRVLGLIHRADASSLTMLDDRDPVDTIEGLYQGVDHPRPAVEAGLRWLRDNRPPARPTVLVHGDLRLGNLLVDASGITGVLDWEIAHLGNPIEDLGWLCVRAWRFGQHAPVAGIGERADLLDGYEGVTGDRPTDDELHWWEVYGTLRWLVLSRVQAYRHLSGAEQSVELAAVGRRVCESEYDLLLALGLLDVSVYRTDVVGPAASSLHDEPVLGDILDLVSATLMTDVAAALPAEASREKYLLKICLHLLGIAGREVATGDADAAGVGDALAAVGSGDEIALATAIRAGAVDPGDPAIRWALSAPVVARLRVANPRHLAGR